MQQGADQPLAHGNYEQEIEHGYKDKWGKRSCKLQATSDKSQAASCKLETRSSKLEAMNYFKVWKPE
ncbi:hypothetical protein BCV02_00545 [Vibrio breoganii]|nr:hypothetical protein BCV02_00545 [Vibrio breoganii]PML83494.1 hypothetical protein BCT67_17185 [Vibrio breoganii]